ncbi:MAG TPA: GAF domain-containing protein [Anaerolineales bacterium]|nr:GAF domain-containing protein [Anaerolineales bacterium]HMZ44751.1 GAF domain-containing protein [Anaerolineales bacterium]HNA55971.1 GAF domain-containing protein [Anaerolineales bacterium]HND93518.1 GAF domain-containing protein [Anaerolineales bacterium]HNE69728.1 GAF domain-containing protein [Anaerolineales bacterium]
MQIGQVGLEFDLKKKYTVSMPTLSKTGQLKELEGRHSLLLRLVELSVTLNSTLDLDVLLQLITATATELLECEASSILLYDEKNPRLFFAAATGSDPAKLAEIPVPIDNSLAGTIFRTNKALILNNAEHDPRHYAPVSEHIKFKTNTLLGVPMPIKDRTMGVLEAVNKRNGAFNDGDVATLSVIASHAAIAINNARMLRTTQQALEKVKVTNQIKSNFLALASHELRTPLGIIIGYATFLQEGAKGESSDHANQVLGAAAQMRALLDQMTNLTLLQTDEMQMRPIRISIQDVLNFAVDEIKYFAARRDLSLVFDFPETPIYVNVDAEKTALAFVNLLNNAIRFSPEGSEIVIGAVEQGKKVLASVRDHGIGIPSDKLQKIFEEFYQIEPPNTRRHGGLGIGLTIAKGLIEAQDGKLWAESDGLEQGSTFKVLLSTT